VIADFSELDPFRIGKGPLGSDSKDPKSKRSGAFSFLVEGMPINVIVVADAGDNDDTGWERASITIQCMRRVKGKKKRQLVDRPPSYEEILQIKDVFWPKDEPVCQYYGEDINDPQHLTVELWRKKDGDMTIPYHEALPVEPNEKKEDNEDDEKGSDKAGTGDTASPDHADSMEQDRPVEAVSGPEDEVSEPSSDTDSG